MAISVYLNLRGLKGQPKVRSPDLTTPWRVDEQKAAQDYPESCQQMMQQYGGCIIQSIG
ncbi:hypothetical protein IQ267_13340 [filamentous cyanobacterium LEGE 07170]|nr:hypothetical protein [filamentous cyanobacterium LEGE 07170]